MLGRWFRQLHWPLIFSALSLVAVGTLFIYSASRHDLTPYLIKQLLWVVAGFGILFLIPVVGYRTFLGIANLFYIAVILLLIWLLFAGVERLGAQRWIGIGFFALQPSEFAKLATILVLANFLGELDPGERSFYGFGAALGIAAVPLLLIMAQPDLGSAILFLPMAGVLLFLWGAKKRYFILSSILGLISAPLLWHFLKPYQKKRLLVFIDPMQDPLGSGYTAIQSKIAVGSGGLWGKGYLAGTQSQLQFVPEHHTDFIFCVIGEEWGFIGAILILVLYGLLLKWIIHIMEQTTDIKAKLVCAGVAAILFSQVFINIGMSIGLMPITGITLPLVSYGGSSLVTTMFALGMILSIYKERSIF